MTSADVIAKAIEYLRDTEHVDIDPSDCQVTQTLSTRNAPIEIVDERGDLFTLPGTPWEWQVDALAKAPPNAQSRRFRVGVEFYNDGLTVYDCDEV